MKLRSFKLQRAERRVRIVPQTDPTGCPFAGPGVDLIDAESDAIQELASPLFQGIEAFEPEVKIRSLSADLQRMRLLVTLEAPGRPRVVRMENQGTVERLLEPCCALLHALEEAADRALARRDSR
ncbi:MAG: hypothetical protein RMJ98_09625 [Myxococcales bacterium]|nr:hypothetical protein [Polyangiaceae bacterium]MDW8249547.1 hypothetical protein [Myxococcales bacterium]